MVFLCALGVLRGERLLNSDQRWGGRPRYSTVTLFARFRG